MCVHRGIHTVLSGGGPGPALMFLVVLFSFIAIRLFYRGEKKGSNLLLDGALSSPKAHYTTKSGPSLI